MNYLISSSNLLISKMLLRLSKSLGLIKWTVNALIVRIRFTFLLICSHAD
jgi:hypothetical protein